MKMCEIANEYSCEAYQITLEGKKYRILEWFLKCMDDERKVCKDKAEVRNLFYQKKFHEIYKKCLFDNVIRLMTSEEMILFEEQFTEFMQDYYRKMINDKETEKERIRADLLRRLEELDS